MPITQDYQFTAANGTNLSGLAGDVGGALTLTGGTGEVQNNRASITSNLSTVQTPDIGTADYTVRVRVRALTLGVNSPTFETRNSGTTTFFTVIGNANEIVLKYYDGSTTSTVGSPYTPFTAAANTDYDVEVTHSGNTHTVKLDGVTIIGPVSYSGSNTTTGVRFGVSGAGSTSTTGWHYDRVTVETLDAAPVAVTPRTAYESGAIIAGTQNLSLLVPLPVSTTHAAPGLKLAYTRAGAATTLGTPVSLTPTGAHTDWGIVPVDATNLPELHRIDLPDAAFAAGADQLTLTVSSTALAAQHFVYKLRPATKVYGTIGTGTSSTTSLATTLTPALNQYARRLLEFTGGTCVGQRVAVVANATDGQLEVAPPLTATPAAGDPFLLH